MNEACGGYADHIGTCRHGLVCEIPESASESDGKCVVDVPNSHKSGYIYRNPKASFLVKDLSSACQKVKSEVKKEAEDDKKEKPGGNPIKFVLSEKYKS